MLIFFFCSDANFTKGKNTIFFFVLQYGISVIFPSNCVVAWCLDVSYFLHQYSSAVGF